MGCGLSTFAAASPPRISTALASLSGAVVLQPLGVPRAPAPLDMDVIDTSWMDSNVQTLRHSYFNVNRWLIDDIRETVVNCYRARERTSRLTHRRGNVWSFLAAPRHVVAT